MKVAIIGYAQAGKSTIYRAAARGLAKGEVTAVPVPDERFDAIVAQVKPKKQTPATVILHDDVEAANGSGKTFSLRFIDQAKKADILLHVVRGFENPVSPYFAEVDPLRDQENLDVELVLADLQIVENRLERLQKSPTVKQSGSPDYLEKQFFDRIKPLLEEGTPLRAIVDMNEDEQTVARNYQFLSLKPMVVAFNVAESGLSGTPEMNERIEELAKKETPAFYVAAPIEEEIAQLDPADQPEFLDSLGLKEPASNVVIKAVYDALGLITFFTAGDNDTRAWPLRKGSNALKAAGTIHNDIAKGFIRAEIVHYSDYLVAGSLDAAYSAGKMSLEGKEYVLQDGDLIHIRNKS
ncbi:MAG: redox-regulated ATPase YchF [Chlorobia bacterium]|nr:redox-regulated ATPase YchF [Fimbriimonadaceae bacterium]